MKKKIINWNFWKCYNENFYGSIVLVVMIVACLILSFYFKNKIAIVDQERMDYATLDVFDKENIGKYVYVLIYERPLVINFEKKYAYQTYAMKVGDKTHIAYLERDIIDNITDEELMNGYRLYGYTEKIDKAIKTKGINYLKNETRNYHLTIDDYSDNFGYLYFYGRKYGELGTNYTLFLILAIFIFCIYLYVLYLVIRFKRNFRKLNDKDLTQLNEEINDKDAVFFGGLYTCKSYLVDTQRLVFYQYHDIESIDINDAKVHRAGIYGGFHIYIKTKKDKKKKRVNSITYLEKSAKSLNEFIEYIEDNCKNIKINISEIYH